MSKAATKKDNEYNAFLSALNEGNPDQLYFFYGEEHYLRERYLEKLRQQLVGEGFEDFNFRRFEGRGLTPAIIADAVDMLPVMAERTLIEVHDYDIFGEKEDAREALADLFSDLPEYVCLVFLFDTIEYKPDSRLKITKTLLKNAHAVEFSVQESEKVVRWVRRHIKDEGKQISPDDAEYLTFLTGGQMTALNTEIAKLCAYCVSDSITRADIDACVAPAVEAAAYKISDAVLNGSVSQAADLVRDILQLQEPAQKVLSTVSQSFRNLLYAKICLEAGKRKDYLMTNFHFKFDFQATNSIRYASKLSSEQCRKMVLICSEAAFDANSGIDTEDIMRDLLLRLFAVRNSSC